MNLEQINEQIQKLQLEKSKIEQQKAEKYKNLDWIKDSIAHFYISWVRPYGAPKYSISIDNIDFQNTSIPIYTFNNDTLYLNGKYTDKTSYPIYTQYSSCTIKTDNLDLLLQFLKEYKFKELKWSDSMDESYKLLQILYPIYGEK